MTMTLNGPTIYSLISTLRAFANTLLDESNALALGLTPPKDRIYAVLDDEPNLSVPEIHRRTGCSPTTISKRRRQYFDERGWTLPHAGRRPKTLWEPSNDAPEPSDLVRST